MKVLVTGNRGFLGRHFVPQLLQEYPRAKLFISNSDTNNLLESLDNDVTSGQKLDFIYHFAAWTKAGDFCLYHPAEQWEINQYINTNILSYWRKYQPQAKMIVMGTSCSYDPELIKCVDNYGKGNVDKNLYSYAMTKRMLVIGVKAYAQQYGMKYQVFIPTTLCGADFDCEDKHFIFDLIRKICDAKKSNCPPTLWGDGYQKREVMYIKDAVNIMLDNMCYNNIIINISRGKELTIREYANCISNIVGYDSGKILYDTNKFVGVRSKQLIPNITYKQTDLNIVFNEMIQYYEHQGLGCTK